MLLPAATANFSSVLTRRRTPSPPRRDLPRLLQASSPSHMLFSTSSPLLTRLLLAVSLRTRTSPRRPSRDSSAASVVSSTVPRSRRRSESVSLVAAPLSTRPSMVRVFRLYRSVQVRRLGALLGCRWAVGQTLPAPQKRLGEEYRHKMLFC